MSSMKLWKFDSFQGTRKEVTSYSFRSKLKVTMGWSNLV